MATFNPDNSYISVSQEAGEQLRQLGLVTQRADVDDFKKMVVGSITTGKIDEQTKEMHFVIETTMMQKPVALGCVARSGSPAGNKDYTVTVYSVMELEKWEERRKFKVGMIGFEGSSHARHSELKKADIQILEKRWNILEHRLRKGGLTEVSEIEITREKTALSKVLELIKSLILSG